MGSLPVLVLFQIPDFYRTPPSPFLHVFFFPIFLLLFSWCVAQVRLKVSLLGFGAAVMVATTDTKWNKKKLPDPDSIKGQPGNTKKRVWPYAPPIPLFLELFCLQFSAKFFFFKDCFQSFDVCHMCSLFPLNFVFIFVIVLALRSFQIVFIRHGESLWNEAFNGSKRPDKFLYQTLRAFFGEFMVSGVFFQPFSSPPPPFLTFSILILLHSHFPATPAPSGPRFGALGLASQRIRLQPGWREVD